MPPAPLLTITKFGSPIAGVSAEHQQQGDGKGGEFKG